MIEPETWRPIPGREGIYEVSDHGRVRSLWRRTSGGQHEGLLRGSITAEGYRRVELRRDGGRDPQYVHRLVLEAFVGPCPDGMEACHGPGGSLDNRVVNLRWDTSAENNHDIVRHGRNANVAKTHCLRDHELAEPNLIPSALRRGTRQCLSCNRARNIVRKHGGDMQAISDHYYSGLTRTLRGKL